MSMHNRRYLNYGARCRAAGAAMRARATRDLKPAREMTVAEIEAELATAKSNGFGLEGGATRFAALKTALAEKRMRGEDEERGTKIPPPKDPKERAAWEALVKKREAEGRGKYVGDHHDHGDCGCYICSARLGHDGASDIVIFAINNFGTGGHPVATSGNLHLFGRDYIAACLKRLIKSPRVSEAAKEAARAAL